LSAPRRRTSRGLLRLTCLLALWPAAGAAQQATWPHDYRGSKTVTAPIYAAGETVRGRIEGADTVSLIDALGREFARARGPDYALTVPAWHTDWNHVVGVAKGREIKREQFLVAAPRGQRDLSDYLVLVWYQPRTEGEARSLWNMGAVGSVGKYWREGHEACLRTHTFWYHHNLESKSCLTTYHANRREFGRVRADYARHPAEPTKYAVRAPCLNDPATFERLDKEQLLKKLVQNRTRDFGTLLFYEIADEGSISKLNAPMDFCFGPHCLREMRTWLKAKYGALAGLNRAWGRSFKSWDEVIPDTTFKAMARADGNYASWSDHRAFMDRTLSRFVAKTAARVKELSGLDGAYFGTEMPSPFGGYDWYQLAKAAPLQEAYNIGDSVECLRSFAPPGTRMYRTFFGTQPINVYKNWRHLFHDQCGVVLWGAGWRVVQRGALTAAARQLAPHLFELRSGVGKLIMDADRVNDRVALHYSQASIRADWMVDAVTESNEKVPWQTRRENYEWFRQRSNGTRGAAIRVIEDNQLQFRFVATPEIEEAVLGREGFRLLVLHHSFAVGAKEASAIRTFVESGGVVVADAQAGTFDGNGTRAKTGLLDELFGVSGIPVRHAPVRDEQVKVELDAARAARLGLSFEGVELRGLPAFDTVKAAGGVVLGTHGKTPVILAKAHGKGLAVYLNLSIAPYLVWRLEVGQPAKSVGFRKLIGALAARAGVRRAASVCRKGSAELLPCTETFRYAKGDYLYFAAMRNYQVREHGLGGELRVRSTRVGRDADLQKAEAVSIRLPRKGHVYDVRARTYLGEVDRVETTLDAFLPALYAILPTRFGRLRAAATFDRTTGYAALAAQIAATTAGAKVGEHIFHVEVTDPAGVRRLHLLKNYAAPGGQLSTRIFLGTNAAPGRWTFLVRDAATGIGCTAALTVAKEGRP